MYTRWHKTVHVKGFLITRKHIEVNAQGCGLICNVCCVDNNLDVAGNTDKKKKKPRQLWSLTCKNMETSGERSRVLLDRESHCGQIARVNWANLFLCNESYVTPCPYHFRSWHTFLHVSLGKALRPNSRTPALIHTIFVSTAPQQSTHGSTILHSSLIGGDNVLVCKLCTKGRQKKKKKIFTRNLAPFCVLGVTVWKIFQL